MYDPTIFENLKVALENQIYDLDNIDGRISILNREDIMDFSVLSRRLTLQFSLINKPEVSAQVILSTDLEDLAGEILEQEGKELGCHLSLRLYMAVNDIKGQCERIEQALNGIWENDIHITQSISFLYKDETNYRNTIEVQFLPKINEENMNELPDFLESVLESLEILTDI